MKKDEKNQSKEEEKKKEQRRLEIEEILSEADRKPGEQMIVDGFGKIQQENEIKKFVLGDIPDDPEKKYDVYYKGIEKLLREYLPKGDKFKNVRDVIREEKSIFLTRGKKKDKKGIRGGDSRMGYIQDMEEIMNLIVGWAANGRNYYELYQIIRGKNEELGYHP